MRIGMLADAYKPHVSGITNYMDLMKERLEAAGHEVHFFTFGDSQYDSRPRIHWTRGVPLPYKGYYLSLWYNRAAQQALQSMNVLHVHHPFLSGRLALRYGRPRGIPILFTNHTRYDLYAQTYARFLPSGVARSLLRAYMPRFCRAIDLTISPSAGMEKILRGMGVDGRIEVVPNGVDLKQFQNPVPRPRGEFSIKNDDVLLMYAGRVANEKNLPLLLRTFREISPQLEDTTLMIVGGGPALEPLKSHASSLGLSSRVRFTGQVPYQSLPAYLAMADAFVTPSVSEVHPLSVIEAMAVGLPIVAIHSPGISDSVEHEVSGLLADDEAQFASNLIRISRDGALRKRLGESARKASARFSIDNTIQAMLQHYEALARKRKP